MKQIAGDTPAAQKPSLKPRGSSKTTAANRTDRRIRKAGAHLALDPSSLNGARRSAMLARVAPELPVLVKQVPKGAEWLYEVKLDGYRMIGFVRDGRTSLVTRRGNDWTHRFPTSAVPPGTIAHTSLAQRGARGRLVNPDRSRCASL